MAESKEFILRWLWDALSTSVGRKFVMAITGLLLCGFLVAHLAGNLLLYAGDAGKSYNEYAHALHKNPGLLAVAEVGLFGLFIAHIVIALQVSAENRLARKTDYLMRQSKQEGRLAADGWRPETWMLASGLIVLGFMVLHLVDFSWELRPETHFYETKDKQPLEPFDKAVAILSKSNPLSLIVYMIGTFVLILHLGHGVQSAFQSLGFNHPKYTPLIKLLGLLFAIVVGLGFFSFPTFWALGR